MYSNVQLTYFRELQIVSELTLERALAFDLVKTEIFSSFICEVRIKGQTISKANYAVLNSPKK